MLDDGCWIWNAALQRDILCFAVFGEFLADTPERYKCGGLKGPSVNSLGSACLQCTVPVRDRLSHLFGQIAAERRDADRITEFLRTLPEHRRDWSEDQTLEAAEHGIKARSVLVDFPHARLSRFVFVCLRAQSLDSVVMVGAGNCVSSVYTMRCKAV